MMDIVLVNWNSGPILRTGLDALSPLASRLAARIVVVDNASTDGSADGIEMGVSGSILQNATNRGFAAACNQGAAVGDHSYVLFLNVDVIATAEALEAAVAVLDQEPDVAVVGVSLRGTDGYVQPSIVAFPDPLALVGHALGLDRLGLRFFPTHFSPVAAHTQSGDVDQVMGAFFLVRRSVFEALGGFDEQFFVFYEELDFSLRIRESGYRTVFLADVSVVHDSEASRSTPFRIYLANRGRILYARKHFSRPAALVVAMATLAGEPVARLVLAAARRSPDAARTALGAARRLWREAPALLGSRPVPGVRA